MKPLKLTFNGINSFSERTEIDFERLTKSGIFGIFGDTGSGKSTILDCICFALYGKVERSREKLDIINYNCDKAEVEFVFDILCEGKRKTYTVDRSIRKKSGVHKAALYESDGGKQTCLADNASGVTKKITELLGVDCEDFGKCIALPQGEFSQFVKSQSSDRIALIERLFNLEKYGDSLKEKIRQQEQQTAIAFETVQAKVETYAEVNCEAIHSLLEKLQAESENVKNFTAEVEKADKLLSASVTLFERRKELDGVAAELKKLFDGKNEIDKLRKSFSALPACKQALQLKNELENKRILLKEKENVYKIYTDKLAKEKINLKSLIEREAETNFDKLIDEYTQTSAKYAACAGKPQKLKEFLRQLNDLREDYRQKEKLLQSISEKTISAEDDVRKAKTCVNEFASFDLDEFIFEQVKGALLKHEYAAELDYLVDFKSRLSPFKNSSVLYEFVENEIREQIKIFKEKVLLSKNYSLAFVKDRLKTVQAEDEERKRLLKVLDEKKNILNANLISAEKCRTELSHLKADGEKLKFSVEEIKNELSKVYGDCIDYAFAESENERLLNELKIKKAEHEKLKISATETISEITVKFSAVTAEISVLAQSTEELERKLSNALKETGFNEVDECESVCKKFEQFVNAEQALAEYDKSFISLTAKKTELEKLKGIDLINEQEINALRRNKDEALAKLNASRDGAAILKNQIENANKRLAEKEVLLKELNISVKQRDLISQLKELTRGNKFLEFIANEYLYDISALASNTLLKLTDGRYFLTYTDNFFVGDNFNGGNLRGVNTLSGGETFLVSLSLALALSETICAKSLKTIEFFFLDEGFGTLDSALVDTVMDALEKLKSSRFTIGVISHVEELKHRIDSKITVIKATESHGSSVQIIC